jgi:hypothetical protein
MSLKIEGGSSLASNIDSETLTVENTVINAEVTLEEKSDDINVKNELIEEVHMYFFMLPYAHFLRRIIFSKQHKTLINYLHYILRALIAKAYLTHWIRLHLMRI